MAELKIISMNEVQSKKVNWLWYPYIPYGKITIIQGDPGECQRQYEIVRKRRRNFVVFRRGCG